MKKPVDIVIRRKKPVFKRLSKIKESQEREPKKEIKKRLVLNILIFCFLLGSAILLALLFKDYLKGKKYDYSKDQALSQLLASSLSPETELSETPSPPASLPEELAPPYEEIGTAKENSTPTPAISAKELKIAILNGSGVKGAAMTYAQKLKSKGYKNVTFGNASSFNYQKTIISYKKGYKEAAETVKADLEKPNALLQEAQINVDLSVVLGKD